MSTYCSSASSSADSRCRIVSIDSVSVYTLDFVSSPHPTEFLFSLFIPIFVVSALTLLICSGRSSACGASWGCFGTGGSVFRAFDVVGLLTAESFRGGATSAVVASFGDGQRQASA